MRTQQAVGGLETSSIAKGIEAMDAMPKAADIEILDARVLARGKFIVVITGTLADVESAMSAAKSIAGNVVVDFFLIPTIHEQVIPAIKAKQKGEMGEALGIIETKEVASTIFAADAAVKKAEVRLIEAKFQPGGKGLVLLTGDIGSVRSAIAAGAAAVQQEGILIQQVVIPQFSSKCHPHING